MNGGICVTYTARLLTHAVSRIHIYVTIKSINVENLNVGWMTTCRTKNF